MTNGTINDAQTIVGNGEGTTSSGNGTPMDRSIGDGVTMRPKEERGGRGVFAPGDVIAGRYVVEKILGEGGMGIVYQCLDKVGGVSVAVKCLPPEVSRNADEMDDIRANYRLVADLHHPNIAGARTLEVDGSTGDYYLVMDLARGVGLKRWMRRNPQATTEAKLAILRQVAAALDYAHGRKVIHRDVKPENVMVDDEDGVKVLDFGLAAQIRSSQSRTSAAVTSRGGTPGYKSPEQWRGKPQREPADVYSFGVMAYWMFAGELPFDGDDPVVLGHAVLTEPVEPVAGLPAHTNAALAKALAKKPEERFASCGAVVDALEGKDDLTQRRGGAEAQGGRACAPRPPQDDGGVRRPAEPVGRRVPTPPQSGGPRPVAAKGILTVAAFILVVAGGIVWHSQRQRQQDAARRQARIVTAQNVEAERLADEERKAKEEAERRRRAEEEAHLAAERKAKDTATEIRIEAKVQQGKVARISDGDGFKARKDALEDVFIRAEAFYDEKSRRWAEAEDLYKDYIEQSKSVITLDGERQQAVAKRSAAQVAFRNAEDAGAKMYAVTRWNEAVGLWRNADARFKEMGFAAAGDGFESAAKQFMQGADEANAEKKRLADEKARLAKEKAEAERVKREKELAEQEMARAAAERERQRSVADNGHDKVQLWEGGPYWATANIGAEKPEDYGYYFWWGDTVGYKRVGDSWKASDGSVQNFSFCVANAPTFGKSLDSLKREGWITEAGVLAPEHDAAHVKWGGDWRMPTIQELKDLNSECDWTWTTMNGVNGYKVRGKGSYASASIFLPCAGYGNGASLCSAGSDGDYWSSVPYSGNYYAWYLYFNSSYLGTYYVNLRSSGQSVRPVQGFTK